MQKFFQTALLIGALVATLRPCGAATLPTLTTLYSFLGEGDGDSPEANVVYNTSTGALYGTTIAGGSSGWGTVFELSQTGGLWTKTAIHSFTGGTDGANPVAGLLLTSGGVLYGTTELGGAKGFGTVFSLTPPTPPSTTWTLTTLYAFTGQNGDGMNPESGLAMNKQVLYGTTTFGGSAGYGTVFSLTPKAGGHWAETVLYSFKGAPTGCGTTGNPACDGANPEAGVIVLSSTGVLYGTTFAGGTLDYGTVYSLTPPTPPATTWTPTLLYSFIGAPSGIGTEGGEPCGTTGQPRCDGANPAGGLVVFTGGILYGTTTVGGNPTGCPLGGFAQGCGAVFQLKPPTPPATTWTESLIYVFTGPPKDGWAPSQNLAIGTTGTLFGATFAGGSTDDNCFPASYLGCGIVYQLKPPVAPATTWTKNTLAIFNDDNGGGPNGVVIGKNGVLYGTTFVGGTTGGNGTVFQIVP